MTLESNQYQLFLDVQDRVNNCLEIAQNHFQVDFSYDEIRLDLRGKSAGQFIVKNAKDGQVKILRFNRWMIEQYGGALLDELIPHECAHLVVDAIYSRKRGRRIRPHGKEWSYVMEVVFGREARIYHDFEPKQTKRQAFLYRCGCNERVHQLSIIRHNKVVRGRGQYRCVDCCEVLEEMQATECC